MLDLWLQYPWLLIFKHVGVVTTISVTSTYLRKLDLSLQYLWRLNIYVCWACDYNIRETSKYLHMYVGHVTTISVKSKCLHILDMWLQYLWCLNIYVCWTCDYNIRETSKYLHMYVGHVTIISWRLNVYIYWTCNYNSVTSKYLCMLDMWPQYPFYI